MLLVSITGYTIATAATAFSPDIAAFAACQFAARMFLAVELSLTWTVVAEELPAESRGFGFGYLATLDILGAGFGSLLYGVVLAPLGVSWRWLYAVVVPVLIVVVWLRRRLPESSRFTRLAEEGRFDRARHILHPPHRRYLIVICIGAFLINLTTQAQVYVVDFLQSQRHLSTSGANLIVVAAGTVAIPSLALAGAMSDRLGRKAVGSAFVVVLLIGLWLFFFIAHSVVPLLFSLSLVYLGGFGTWPTIGAFGTELFPTGLRALGASAGGAFKVLGQCAGFVVAGAVIAESSLPRAVAVLAIGPAIGVLLMVLLLPETKGRDVDEITAALDRL